MSQQLIECVPNISEGSNFEVINAIKKAITNTPGINFLHQTSDQDHNRTVFTFTGTPESVPIAAFAMVRKASELIDITKHQGVHPRIGATDVLPLIPLKNISTTETVKIAENLGQRIATELQIPIYLYEDAAKKEERRNLADVRNREHLKDADFQPENPHPTAGKTALGVREILIAFNVNLASNDLKKAKLIAKKIRESSGGLPHLKALGLELESKGFVQISMNLTNYKKTSPQMAYKAISNEAQKLGIEILETELIGMIPQKAIFDKMDVSESQILKF